MLKRCSKYACFPMFAVALAAWLMVNYVHRVGAEQEIRFTSIARAEVCDNPQPIFGRATLGGRGVANAVMELYTLDTTNKSVLVAVTRTSSFGYYRFTNIMPCSDYAVRIRSKRTGFASNVQFVWVAEFPADGSGVERNFHEE